MAATTLSLLLLPLDEAGHYGSIPKILGIALVLLLSWRVVRFTVIPLFCPDDPKELPYWIPGMMKNDWTFPPPATRSITNLREQYGVSINETGPPKENT